MYSVTEIVQKDKSIIFIVLCFIALKCIVLFNWFGLTKFYFGLFCFVLLYLFFHFVSLVIVEPSCQVIIKVSFVLYNGDIATMI